MMERDGSMRSFRSGLKYIRYFDAAAASPAGEGAATRGAFLDSAPS
jgi:hypothetical protein